MRSKIYHDIGMTPTIPKNLEEKNNEFYGVQQNQNG